MLHVQGEDAGYHKGTVIAWGTGSGWTAHEEGVDVTEEDKDYLIIYLLVAAVIFGALLEHFRWR